MTLPPRTFKSCICLTLAFGACADVTPPPWAPGRSVPTDSGITPDSGIEVQLPRSLRGVYVATVIGLDFPAGAPPAEQPDALRTLIDQAHDAGMNAVFLQVRPEGDALYRSALEPWSRYLTGLQGVDPGYDPLQTAIDHAHALGLQVHAWINPYRAARQRTDALDDAHMARRFPDHAHDHGSYLWMDPGAVEVREHIVDVTADLLASYDVDGLHLDDYFYPYPSTDGPDDFPDGLTWQAYVDGGGTLSRGDWRRHNVHTLVASLHELVRDEAPHITFGISPFGIYRPGMPEGIVGLDQVEAIYSDPLHWLEQDHVDYLAPQLYWPTTRTAQAFEPLLDWWADQTPDHIGLAPALIWSNHETSDEWPSSEFALQHRLVADHPDASVTGFLGFRARALSDDGLLPTIRPTGAALPPQSPRASSRCTAPSPTLGDDAVRLSNACPDARFAVLLRVEEGHARLLDVVGVAESLPLPEDRADLHIATVARDGRLSPAVPLP